MSSLVAGVDVGGTTTKACIVADGKLLADVSVPTNLESTSALGDLIVSAVGDAVSGTGNDVDDLAAIGVGVPGQVSSGRVHNAANLGIDESGYDLGSHVSRSTGVPAFVENDMTVAAYGAYAQLSEAEPGLANLVYIGLGTGVSAGVVLERQVFRGSRGLAGEFGHVPMGTGLRCACGSMGCLETVIGATGLRDAWNGELSSTLFRSAASGDHDATAVIDHAIGFLATAMWWLAATYDPDCFLIGGGVGINNPAIKTLIAGRWLQMASESALARKVLDPDRIRISDLEEPVGAYGAALLAAGGSGRPGATIPEKTWEEENRK